MIASSSFDLVVLGAGPAGLAAAWEASLAGRSVCVIEQAPSVGGLCATVERNGFRFDLGGHRIISKRATLVHRLRALMGDALEERTRKSVVLLRGQRFTYPLVAREQRCGELLDELARAIADYARERAMDTLGLGRADRDFRGWVLRRFGRTLYELFFGPYTEKLWGMPAHQLSSDWASQRISLLNLADVGLRLAGLRRGGARTYARRYLYPTRGIGALFERLACELATRGVRFVYERKARAFERDPDHGRVRAVHIARDRHTNGGTEDPHERCECGAVIATIPLAQTASLVCPEDRSLEAHTAALRHRGMRFVNVLLEGSGPVLDATWMYIADPRYAMTRVQEPAERSASMTPPGHASLMLELPADPGESTYTEPDARLAARLLDELASLGLDVRSRVIDVFSTRAPFAYPRYILGYDRHRDTLLDAVRRAPNVWTIGRQGLFRYVFMDTAMEMGFSAARAFIDGRPNDVHAILEIDRNPTLHEVQSVLG